MSLQETCKKLRNNLRLINDLIIDFNLSLQNKERDLGTLQQAKNKLADLCQKQLDLYFYTKFPESVRLTVEIGDLTAQGLIAELEKKGVNIGQDEKKMITDPEYKWTKQKKKLNVIILSAENLGFEEDAWEQNIYKKAEELGLVLAPEEVGPYLMLQYKDQPLDSYIIVASKNIITRWQLNLSIWRHHFLIIHNRKNEYHLSSTGGDPLQTWKKNQQWAFVIP